MGWGGWVLEGLEGCWRGADLQKQSAASPEPAQPAPRAWLGLGLGLAKRPASQLLCHLSYLCPPPLHCPRYALAANYHYK